MFEISIFLKERLVGRTTFTHDEVRIGRSADNEIQIDNLALSRYHASIELVEDMYVLKDFATPNGTFVNGDRLDGRRGLEDGDRISIGKFSLLFRTEKVTARGSKAKVGDKAAYAVAGETMTGADQDLIRERSCPFVGFIESTVPGERPVVHLLSRDAMVLGSSGSCDIIIDRGGAPARAATIVRSWRGFLFVPLSPQALVNDAAVDGAARPLAHEDRLTFGAAVYRFCVGAPEAGP